MGNHDDGLVSQHTANAVLEYVLPHVCVDGGQDVIQQVHVGLGVHCAGQTHPLLLPPGKIDSAFMHVGVGAWERQQQHPDSQLGNNGDNSHYDFILQ